MVIAALVALALPIAFIMASAQADSTDEDNALVTRGYLCIFRRELKQEIMAELSFDSGNSTESEYREVLLTEGQTILLSENCEIIYRGGGAIAVTCSDHKGDGITDMSSGGEIFSGEALQYGHIYFASDSPAEKYILVTGNTAYFTVRGDFDIA